VNAIAARAGELIRLLRLEPHPEGGHYREIFRSGTCALCGCTEAPGFEFEDFAFLRDSPAGRDALRALAPELATLL
jgi:predicted cupin superfamily sugar epimerase